MTKEERREYDRAYRLKNKDKLKEYLKTYHKSNEEKIAAQKKALYRGHSVSYTIVYCIPNYNGKGDNYCGITSNPYKRMINHKRLNKQNTSDWFILDVKLDRKEALESEKIFHSKGYYGKRGDKI